MRHVVSPHHLAVIGEKNQDGVVSKTAGLKTINQAPNLRIDMRNQSVIVRDILPPLVVRHVRGPLPRKRLANERRLPLEIVGE